MTLGELIEALKQEPLDNMCIVWGPFPSLWVPQPPGSYRGFYSDLALGVGRADEVGDAIPSVREVLGWLQDAVGRAYAGYKGGQYTMTLDTLVWVSPPAEASGYRVTGVQSRFGFTRLTYAHEEH